MIMRNFYFLSSWLRWVLKSSSPGLETGQKFFFYELEPEKITKSKCRQFYWTPCKSMSCPAAPAPSAAPAWPSIARGPSWSGDEPVRPRHGLQAPVAGQCKCRGWLLANGELKRVFAAKCAVLGSVRPCGPIVQSGSSTRGPKSATTNF